MIRGVEKGKQCYGLKEENDIVRYEKKKCKSINHFHRQIKGKIWFILFRINECWVDRLLILIYIKNNKKHGNDEGACT